MNKLLILLLFPIVIFAQKTSIIKGKIIDEFSNPIEDVAISYLEKGTTTDKDGFYEFQIPINKTVSVIFKHVSFRTLTKKFTTRRPKTINFSAILNSTSEELKEINIKNRRKEAQGITKIDAQKLNTTVGANSGVETILMTLPGVNNNNELSTQYNVRGGNFDENLVYVNGIEVYRPFLVRSGQQEGLSFINSHLVQNIDFSAGGFQAKYGDKLSSVLDITYRKPKEFGVQLDLSLLGGSFSIENLLAKDKLSAILGVRYRNNSLLVNSRQTEVNFRPNFTDVQTFLSYEASDKLDINFLGNFSLNNYNYIPITRVTRFGTVTEPVELRVVYQGEERDRFLTLFGALSADYQVNDDFKLTGTVSSFNTQEEEHFDIVAAYSLGDVDADLGSDSFGELTTSQGIGTQLNHARNDLDALITNVQLRAKLKDGDNEWRAGVKYQNENIKDRIREWELIDSLGFSIRPPNTTITQDQPYTPFTGPLEPFQDIRAENEVDIDRVSGFLQFSRKTDWKDHDVWINAGVRAHSWTVSPSEGSSESHVIISPRAQVAIKPDWDKDMLFRFSGGIYSQPPFYKELRDFDGVVHPEVKAQKSLHIVAGNDYSFDLWDRPFKLTTEIYYKDLWDVNSYSVDNVRIRYRADNVTKAYAYGLDLRLNGEFVPGNDSWVSIGFLKTEENIDNRGWIARPTDQRLKAAILLQDYVPNLPSLKAYLNLVYNTGTPGGAPAYADVYEFRNRLSAYRRADLGISYVFVDANKKSETGFLRNFKELNLGIELFNMFDVSNSITNTWVRDAFSKTQFAVPNFLSGRVLNVKLRAKL